MLRIKLPGLETKKVINNKKRKVSLIMKTIQSTAIKTLFVIALMTSALVPNSYAIDIPAPGSGAVDPATPAAYVLIKVKHIKAQSTGIEYYIRNSILVTNGGSTVKSLGVVPVSEVPEGSLALVKYNRDMLSAGLTVCLENKIVLDGENTPIDLPEGTITHVQINASEIPNGYNTVINCNNEF